MACRPTLTLLHLPGARLQNERFRLPKRQYNRQYAQLYFSRLKLLEAAVRERAAAVWPGLPGEPRPRRRPAARSAELLRRSAPSTSGAALLALHSSSPRHHAATPHRRCRRRNTATPPLPPAVVKILELEEGKEVAVVRGPAPAPALHWHWHWLHMCIHGLAQRPHPVSWGRPDVPQRAASARPRSSASLSTPRRPG
jgi:hypothetical protein